MKNEKKAIKTPHYIVGIGASAGGMEALHEFFDYMRPDTGLSFVVVQHLSPDYKSLMSELLAKHTMMQVFEAADAMEVMPDCIYVIPSKKLLTIKNGKLHLAEKLKTAHPNNAIDIFFESLAGEKKEQAIAIILSGTGTDGTKGAEAIKNNGGMVVVQDPISAGFDGMPTSVISSGFSDMVLTPEMMSDEIMDFLKESPSLRMLGDISQKEEAMLRDILQHVKQVTGNDFTHYKRPTLFRRLAKRMMEVSAATIEQYKEFLTGNEKEIKALGREFLINVTRFFRDTEAFETLRSMVLPSIVSDKKHKDQIKIWCMACSTGEEAYSIAILFAEYLGRNKLQDLQVKIFATDIDPNVLEVASKGVYQGPLEKEIPSSLLQKYFIKEDNNYRVTPDIRKMVVFARHDVLKDPPFSKMDLLLCRNMLIYFDPYLQSRVLQKIHFALNINSFVFLGSSENPGQLTSVLEEISRKWKIFKCISKNNVIDSEAFVIPFSNKMNFLPGPPQAKNALNNLAEIFKDTLVADRVIAGIFIDKEFNVKQAIGNFKSFLEFPDGNLHFNLLKMVSSDMAVALGVNVRKALTVNETIIVKNVVLHEGKNTRYVNIIVKPYLYPKDYNQPFLFIVIEEREPPVDHVKTFPDSSLTSHTEQLEKELRETRENLQAIIEELESANEELQGNNEEMISTNEELQSTNEELQSLNEELHTVSAEHQNKIKELLELNDDMNNYFRNSDIGQVFVDRRLHIRKFSPAVAPIINLISNDVGRSLVDIANNMGDTNFINDIKEVIRTGASSEKEIRLTDGSFYLMRINPYLKRDMSIDGAVINFINITESKRLSGILDAVFNSSTYGIAAKKAVRNESGQIIDFRYLTINNCYAEIYGKSLKQLAGHTLKEMFPDVSADYIHMCTQVVEYGAAHKAEYYRRQNDKWYEIVVVKMDDGIVSTHTDITEKRKTSETIANNYQELKNTSEQLMDSNMQLERSNMDLMQFASVASHDLKEPLRKIQVFGNILTDKLKEKFDDHELTYMQKITQSSKRMQVLIEDVLTLSKLSNSDLPRDEVDLGKTINRILDDLEIMIRDKNARINVSDMPVIQAVPGQLHQVFQNLISNALKFNDKKTPSISISQKNIKADALPGLGLTGKPDHFVCIEVKDNGIGFEEQYTEKIFGLFQRLNGRQFEGTGIGLAIVKKIIENHGGAIRAISTPGKGTSFNIYLPR
jgi:two-component system CheB/CheR fusion protein